MVDNPVVSAIVERAEGLPLYVHHVLEDLRSGHFRFADLAHNLPRGLSAYYDDLLRRMSIGDLQAVLTPLIVTLAWARAPLDESVLQLLLVRRRILTDGEDGERLLRQGLRATQSIIRREGTGYLLYHPRFQEHVKRDERNLLQQQNVLARHEFVNLSSGWRGLDPECTAYAYALRHGPSHLIDERKWDQLETILTDLDFVAAKCALGMKNSLLEDLAFAQDSLPEGNEATAVRERREKRLAKFARDLLSYARGEIDHLDVPDSVEVKTPQMIEAEERRVREAPTQRERIAAYRNFVAANAHLLEKWGGSRRMVLQFAFNYARSSSVAADAERLLESDRGPYLHEPSHLRNEGSTFPALIAITRLKDVPAKLGFFEEYDLECRALEFSADGQQLLALDQDGLTLWRVAQLDRPTDRKIDLPVAANEIYHARLSADAAHIVTSQESGLSIWTPEGVCTQRVPMEESRYHLAITSDAEWAATHKRFSNQLIEEWHLSSPSFCCRSGEDSRSRTIDALAMSADGKRIVTAHHDLLIRLHTVYSDAPPKAVPLRAEEILDIRLVAGGRLLVAYTQDSEALLAVLDSHLTWTFCVPIGEVHLNPLPIATSEDGNRAFVGQKGGLITCFDLSTGECIRVFQTSTNSVDTIALRGKNTELVVFSSKNGKALVTEIWALANGGYERFKSSWDGDSWRVEALLPEGRIVVTNKKKAIDWIEVRDWRTGQLKRSLGQWERAGDKVVVPNQGEDIFTGSYRNGIMQWNLGRRTGAASIGENGHTVREFAADAGGRVGVSSREDSPLRIWDLQNHVLIKEVESLSDWEAKVCMSDDGKYFASVEHSFVLRVWDGIPGGSRTEACELSGHRSSINAIAITPDGSKILSGGWDKTARVWDVASRESRILSGHQQIVKEVAITADGKIGISTSEDMTTRVWDLLAAREIKTIDRGCGPRSVLSMTADGSIAATGHDRGRLKFWDIQNGVLKGLDRRHDYHVSACCLLPGSRILVSGSGGGNATVGIWSLADPTDGVLIRATNWDESVTGIVPLAVGFASTGGDGVVRIWSDVLQECVAILGKQDGGDDLIAAMGDGRYLVSASENHKSIQLWDVAGRNCVQRFEAIADGVLAIACSIDGRRIASVNSLGQGNLVQLWDLVDGRASHTWPWSARSWNEAICFTPRDKLLVTEGYNRCLLDHAGKHSWEFRARAVAVNPSGDDLVMVYEEGMHCVDIATGERKHSFNLKGPVSIGHLEIAPDGKWLVSAGYDGIVCVWDIDSGECVAIDDVESRIFAMSRVSSRGLFAFGTEQGEVLVRQIGGVKIGPLVVTPFRPWIIDDNPHWGDSLVVRCPECAQTTALPGVGVSPAKGTRCAGCGSSFRFTTFTVDNWT